jgi:hypothetical protein
MDDDKAKFFDWDNWETSNKGNPFLQRELCKVTIFPSKYGDGWCWCVHWEDRTDPVFSPTTYPDRDGARESAWDEVATGETQVPVAWQAAALAWEAFNGLNAWQRELALSDLRYRSNRRGDEERQRADVERWRREAEQRQAKI